MFHTLFPTSPLGSEVYNFVSLKPSMMWLLRREFIEEEHHLKYSISTTTRDVLTGFGVGEKGNPPPPPQHSLGAPIRLPASCFELTR